MKNRRASCALGASLLLGWLGQAGPAQAEPSATQQCIDAHASGQVTRGQGDLLKAKQHFLSCAAESCPQMIRDDCAKFGSEVDAALPSVVVVARSSSGRDLASATVRIDDSSEALPVDGRALLINPGRHVFELSTQDGSRATVTVVIREAEKYQRVVAEVVLPAQATPEGAPETATTGPNLSPLVYVFGGLGVVAASSFMYFGLDGRDREKELDKCAPDCSRSDVDAMRRSYLIADVSLGVAAASLGLGAYFLFRSPAPSSGSGSSAVSVSTGADLHAIRIRAAVEF